LLGNGKYLPRNINNAQDIRTICLALWTVLVPGWWTLEESLWLPPLGHYRISSGELNPQLSVYGCLLGLRSAWLRACSSPPVRRASPPRRPRRHRRPHPENDLVVASIHPKAMLVMLTKSEGYEIVRHGTKRRRGNGPSRTTRWPLSGAEPRMPLLS